MWLLRKPRDFLKRLEVPLYFVTAALALYLAGGNMLRAAEYPDAEAWAVGTRWFTGLLVAALWVPIYALYKALDAYFEGKDKAANALTHDLELLCQQTVAAIAEKCAGVGVNDLAAQVWGCSDDDHFEELARFFLPHYRPGSGVTWRRGKGVAGTAWKTDKTLHADLRPVYKQLRDLGPEAFNKLPADKRFGMTAEEFESSKEFTGICAICLHSHEQRPKLLGVFVIDYVGDGDFQCVAAASRARPVSAYTGGAEELLTKAKGDR